MHPDIEDRDRRPPKPDEASPQVENNRIVFVTLSSIAITLLVSAGAPAPLFLPMVSGLLLLTAAGTLMIALIVGQPIWPSHFTFWDKGALLAFLGLLAGLFADHEAARAFLAAQADVSGAVDGSAAAIAPSPGAM